MKFCPNCGAENIAESTFCKECGFKFKKNVNMSQTSNSDSNIDINVQRIDSQPTSQPVMNKKVNIIAGIVMLVAIMGGLIIYQRVHTQHVESEIRSAVRNEWKSDDASIKIDEENKWIYITPKGRLGATVADDLNYTATLDSYLASFTNQYAYPSVSRISETIKKKAGSGWTEEFLNPINHKRMLFRFKDGSKKYSIEDDY